MQERQQQESSSLGSADCISCSPSSSDSPLSITPDLSVATISGQSSIPGSLGEDLCGGICKRFNEASAPGESTQIDAVLNFAPLNIGSHDGPPFATPSAGRAVTTAVARGSPTTGAKAPMAQWLLCSPLTPRFQMDLSALTGSVPGSSHATVATLSDSDDAGSVNIISNYPNYTTPSKYRATPSFTNPLFDESPCLSPWTQSLSAFAGNSRLVSRFSPPVFTSPTRRPFNLSPTRRNLQRRCSLQFCVEERTPPSRSPESDAVAAAALAASSLLCRVALRGRSSRNSLESSVASILRSQLQGLREGITPQACPSLRHNERHAYSGKSSDADRNNSHNSDSGEVPTDERMGVTLEVMVHAAELQRQLVVRTEEVAALQLQLEEAISARDEMGLHLLQSQEYIAVMERRLEEDARARNALVVQSELLQQQLQEACDGWSNQDGQAPRGARQVDQGLLHVQQLSSYAPSKDGAAAAPARSATPTIIPVADSALASAAASTASAEGDGLASNDTWGADIEKMHSENVALTQQLIQRSIEAAQARGEEQAARHRAHQLEEINQQYAEIVHTLSLELSLLRPNACGRARGVFSLPFMRKGIASPRNKGGENAGT